MQIIRIDESNFRSHLDKIALVFGLTQDDLESRLPRKRPRSLSRRARCIPEEILTSICADYQRRLGGNDGVANFWFIVGSVAQALLGDLPGQGFTFMEGNQVISIITWFEGSEMLGRLFVHEWCHARRLVNLEITCQAEYVRYLAAPAHWLYEELLAIATEKLFYPHLSWERAAGHPHNRRLRTWDQQGLLQNADLTMLATQGVLDQWLDRRKLDRGAFVYYLAYRLCLATPGITEQLKELMALPATKGLTHLCLQIAPTPVDHHVADEQHRWKCYELLSP